MAELQFTILGCGSSGGVPRIGNIWGDCDPTNPKNRRSRCSLLVELIEGDAATRVIIDTGPDLREQLIREEVGLLDGVVYTHPHADHVHGIDDLRMVVYNRKERLPVWADVPTTDALLARFGYAFIQPPGSSYPPILDLRELRGPFEVMGAAGPIPFIPFEVTHGRIDALGFRIGPLAYLPDVSAMSDAAWQAVKGAECWILDALRYTPHPTHSHVEQSLAWIAQAGVPRGVLTNLHIDLDYARLNEETPDHIAIAHDGFKLRFDLEKNITRE